MPAAVGGQAWDGQVIFQGSAPAGAAYEYRLVRWEEQRRIGFRWIEGVPAGYRPCVTLDAALYPAIIANILLPGAQRETRAFLGPVLADGYYLDEVQEDLNAHYRHPQEVTAPENQLGPFAVVLNKGPGNCAYMIGMWDGRMGFGFRWNGTRTDPHGYPSGRGGTPMWMQLEANLNAAAIELLARGVRGPHRA